MRLFLSRIILMSPANNVVHIRRNNANDFTNSNSRNTRERPSAQGILFFPARLMTSFDSFSSLRSLLLAVFLLIFFSLGSNLIMPAKKANRYPAYLVLFVIVTATTSRLLCSFCLFCQSCRFFIISTYFAIMKI